MNATVRRLVFIDLAFPVISLVAPNFIRPSSDGGGMFDGGTGCACMVFRDRICHIAAIGFCCSATAASIGLLAVIRLLSGTWKAIAWDMGRCWELSKIV